MKKKNIGSSFDSLLREDGIYEEVSAGAIKRVLARQVEAAMKEKPFLQGRDGAQDAYQPCRSGPVARPRLRSRHPEHLTEGCYGRRAGASARTRLRVRLLPTRWNGQEKGWLETKYPLSTRRSDSGGRRICDIFRLAVRWNALDGINACQRLTGVPNGTAAADCLR